MCVKLCVCVHYVCKHACVQTCDVQGQYVQMNILDCRHVCSSTISQCLVRALSQHQIKNAGLSTHSLMQNPG